MNCSLSGRDTHVIPGPGNARPLSSAALPAQVTKAPEDEGGGGRGGRCLACLTSRPCQVRASQPECTDSDADPLLEVLFGGRRPLGRAAVQCPPG